MALWRDPEELVTLTIRLPRFLLARIKATASIVETTPSELLTPLLKKRFAHEALERMQREWIDGWRAQQDSAQLEEWYGDSKP